MSGFNFSSGTPGGFSFGGVTSTTGGSTGGFSLGGLGTATTSTTTSSLGLGGGLFAQKPTTGFSFGTSATGTTAPATGLTLVTTPATGFTLGFNKPAASATPFSLTASSAPTGLTLSSALTSTAPQASSTGGFTLGGNAPASTSFFGNTGSTGLGQSSLSLGLGSTSVLGLGLSSLTSSTSTTSTTTASSSIGLGGIDFSVSSEKSDKSSGAQPEDSKALKDENLPPVICQDVDNFQKFVKEQKQLQEDISRMSSKAMLKVQDDIKSLRQLLSVSGSGLQRSALAIDKLKVETAQELKNADIALHTQKTPPGLQHENTAPSDYFRGLVEQFEVQLQQYRQQIEELENHLAAQGSGPHITPQDLSLAMQKLYQTFVALAAQLQSVHENVKILKHQYLGYRKAFLGDSTDVFESRRVAGRKWQSAPQVTTGPTPFGGVPNAAAVAMAATLTQQQQPAPAFGGGPSFGGVTAPSSSFAFASGSKPSGGSLSAGFGSSNTSGFSFSNPGITASAGLTFGVSNTPAGGLGVGAPLLQLKKPPAGNKRGKR